MAPNKPHQTCQYNNAGQERGGKAPVVSAVAAGGNSSAFLTRAPDEFPDAPGPQVCANS